MKKLIIDGMNFFHRARAGFQEGPHPLMFNFYRNLRSIVEMHKPDKVYYVLEGRPKHRHELHAEYKANRIVNAEDEHYEKKVDEISRLFEGHTDVLEMMAKCFPITVIKHPHFECDDVIAHLVSEYCDELSVDVRKENEVTIVSSDTDFIQLLQKYHNLKIYNAVKKGFVEPPKYNYLFWKAMRGDSTDNISGIPGCGDKTAEKISLAIVNDPSMLELNKYLQAKPGREDTFKRNLTLMTLSPLSEQDQNDIMRHEGKSDFDEVKRIFDSYGFKSITNEKSWDKFVSTFKKLESC